MDFAVDTVNRDSQVFNEVFTNFLIFLHLFTRAKVPRSIRLDNQTAIVTGSNRGIGRKVAEDLVSRGARVIIACRNTTSGDEAASEIRSQFQDANVSVKKLDLASTDSIRLFASDIIENETKVDILINNAGVILPDRYVTDDGLEMMHVVNFLGPSLLTMLLLDKMGNTSSDPRVINVASLAHHDGGPALDPNMLSWNRTYHYFQVYGHSKLAVILFTRELAQKVHSRGIRVYGVDPGMALTDLVRHMEPPFRFMVHSGMGQPLFRTPSGSAESIMWAVVHPKNEYNPKVFYFGDGQPKATSRAAQSQSSAKLLWSISRNLLHFPDIDENNNSTIHHV